MKTKKGQMFVVTALFMSGLIFTVQQALITYSLIDLSQPYQTKEIYMIRNVIDAVNDTIKGSPDWDSFLLNVDEVLMEMNDNYRNEGYVMEVSADKRSGNWMNAYPDPPPYRLNILLRKTYESVTTVDFYKNT